MLVFSTTIVLIALAALVSGDTLQYFDNNKICTPWQYQTTSQVSVLTSTKVCQGSLDAEFSTYANSPIYRWCCPYKPVVESAIGPAPTGCGRQAAKPLLTRIVGGQEAVPYSWPWIVSIQYRGSHFCGGTLIDQYHVLTAAHCLQDSTKFNQDLTIVAGLYYQSKPNPQRVQRYNYEKITNHPQYSGSTHENDVAVIRLGTPATLNSYVNIACLPGKDPVLDESVMIAGWGTTKFEGSSPDALNQAKVEIMDYCKYIYGSYDDKKQLCAGNKLYTKDSCQGDSGGPLVYQVNGQWIISGVVSYGDGCAKINRPGVYARVSYYLGWIRSVTGSASGK